MSYEVSSSYAQGSAAANAIRSPLGGAQSKSLSADQLLPKAKEFESILLGQWLQGAESSFGSVPGADEDKDAGDDQFKNFAVQQLAKNITNAGGIGIAGVVAKALAKSASPHETDVSPPGDLSR